MKRKTEEQRKWLLSQQKKHAHLPKPEQAAIITPMMRVRQEKEGQKKKAEVDKIDKQLMHALGMSSLGELRRSVSKEALENNRRNFKLGKLPKQGRVYQATVAIGKHTPTKPPRRVHKTDQLVLDALMPTAPVTPVGVAHAKVLEVTPPVAAKPTAPPRQKPGRRVPGRRTQGKRKARTIPGEFKITVQEKPIKQLSQQEIHNMHKKQAEERNQRQQTRFAEFRKRQREMEERRWTQKQEEEKGAIDLAKTGPGVVRAAEVLYAPPRRQLAKGALSALLPKEYTGTKVIHGIKLLPHKHGIRLAPHRTVRKKQEGRRIAQQVEVMNLGKQRGLLAGIHTNRENRRKARQAMELQKRRDQTHIQDTQIAKLTDLFQKTGTKLTQAQQQSTIAAVKQWGPMPGTLQLEQKMEELTQPLVKEDPQQIGQELFKPVKHTQAVLLDTIGDKIENLQLQWAQDIHGRGRGQQRGRGRGGRGRGRGGRGRVGRVDKTKPVLLHPDPVLQRDDTFTPELKKVPVLLDIPQRKTYDRPIRGRRRQVQHTRPVVIPTPPKPVVTRDDMIPIPPRRIIPPPVTRTDPVILDIDPTKVVIDPITRIITPTGTKTKTKTKTRTRTHTGTKTVSYSVSHTNTTERKTQTVSIKHPIRTPTVSPGPSPVPSIRPNYWGVWPPPPRIPTPPLIPTPPVSDISDPKPPLIPSLPSIPSIPIPVKRIEDDIINPPPTPSLVPSVPSIPSRKKKKKKKKKKPTPSPTPSPPPTIRTDPSDPSDPTTKPPSKDSSSGPSSKPRPGGGSDPDPPRPPGRRSKVPRHVSGGIQGMDVQRAPNFSIEQQGPSTYLFVARRVNAGVRTQIASFLRRVRGKLFVNGERMSKRAALKKIPSLLRKGTVEIKIE